MYRSNFYIGFLFIKLQTGLTHREHLPLSSDDRIKGTHNNIINNKSFLKTKTPKTCK